MKVVITIESNSDIIAESLQNISGEFTAGCYDKVELGKKKKMEYSIYDGSDANDGYGNIIGSVLVTKG